VLLVFSPADMPSELLRLASSYKKGRDAID